MRCLVCRTAPVLAGALLLVGAGGCFGPARYEVTGHVKYNGAPLRKPGGQVIFVGPDGNQAAAAIEEDGAYRVANVTAGPNRVAVYYLNPNAKTGKRMGGKKGEKAPPSNVVPTLYLTPEKYATVEKSNLAVEVTEGKVFDVDLTGSPIR